MKLTIFLEKMFFNCAANTFQKMIKDTKKDLKTPLITT